MTAAVPVGDVQARIAEIESRFPLWPAPSVAATSSSGQPEAFASVLADVQRGASATTATPPEVASGWPAPMAAVSLGEMLAATGRAPTPSAAVAAPTATGQSVGDAAGRQAVALAKEHLGVPYVWGGTTPAGFDCSGLVQHVYDRLGVDLPRVSRDQARVGVAVPSLAQARPGDLVAFGEPVDHIGIYAGNNTMVVAPRTGDVVKVQEITRPVATIRRVLP